MNVPRPEDICRPRGFSYARRAARLQTQLTLLTEQLEELHAAVPEEIQDYTRPILTGLHAAQHRAAVIKLNVAALLKPEK